MKVKVADLPDKVKETGSGIFLTQTPSYVVTRENWKVEEIEIPSELAEDYKAGRLHYHAPYNGSGQTFVFFTEKPELLSWGEIGEAKSLGMISGYLTLAIDNDL